jgi:hypothetical protein
MCHQPPGCDIGSLAQPPGCDTGSLAQPPLNLAASSEPPVALPSL